MLSTKATLEATISRRAPKADAKTRTIHFEIDIADPNRQFQREIADMMRRLLTHARDWRDVAV